jgi:potassium-transporting ATPase KdpC subunit
MNRVKEILQEMKIAFLLLILMSILTGFIYPLFVTAIAQLVFPWQANGSLIKRNGYLIGSELIGQSFTDPKYFWGRPSATTPFPYNAMNSSGSNLALSNPKFLGTVESRRLALRSDDWGSNALIPEDLVMASGSGLDPDISPSAAFYQIKRVAKARGIPEQRIRTLVENSIAHRTFGILGEDRINVLRLNLALDSLP